MEDMETAERSEEERAQPESSGLFVDDVPKPVISRELLEDESWDDDEELELGDVKRRQKKQQKKKPQGRASKRARRSTPESADEGEEAEAVSAGQETGIENEDFLFENDPSIDRIVSQSLRHDPTLVRAQMTGSEARRVLGSAKKNALSEDESDDFSAPHEEVGVSSNLFVRLEDQPVLGVTLSSVREISQDRFIPLETTVEELNLTPSDVLELVPIVRTSDQDPNLVRAQPISSTVIIDLDDEDEDEGKSGPGGGDVFLEEPVSQVYGADLNSQTENLIHLRIRSKEGSKKYRMRKSDPLQKTLVKFCAAQNRKSEDAKMIFDGDIIRGSQTPEMLDLEDEDIVEVAYQN